ncbi:MAG: LLM class flavin-dependent oxidoreductase [Candidatus Heimdallarchaeaceae archaeon]|jgi:alkanesulfonate monooxygenase SsuD/methylene tetrahydromethanopterin reductase-like flavin-dependent oxidoreductase (luciferase family)
MTHEDSFRIGVITIQNAPWKKLVERWKFIDSTEFDSLWVADHFVHWKEKEMTFFECWTTLAGMATETSRIRIGTTVTNMRALTVDHISTGRLELGLGAGGGSKLEYSMTGIEMWSPKEKVERFREYVEIIDQLLRNPVTTYNGKYYNLEETVMQPDPVQKPRPPITIGAKGSKMLRIVAEYADAWNILEDITSLEESVEKVEERNNLLNNYCVEIGRDTKSIRRTFGVYESEAMHNIGPMKLYENPEILEDLVKMFLEIGISDIFIPYPFKEKEMQNFEQIAQEMVPDLKRKYS